MTLIKWPGTRNFPSVFDDFFSNDLDFLNPSNGTSTVPAVNISESKESYNVDLAAPGKSKEDFNIEVKNGSLIISSESEDESETTEKDFSRREYHYSSFKRSFSLPQNVDKTNISASYNDGILTIQVPKLEPSDPEKIAVEVK